MAKMEICTQRILYRIRTSRMIKAIKASRPVQRCREFGAFCNTNRYLLQIALIILYRLCLDFVYIKEISPLYSYAGFTVDLNPLWYLCTLLTVAIFSPFLAALLEKQAPSAAMITFISLLYFIPLTSYCGCRQGNILFFIIGICYWAILLLLEFRLPILYIKRPSYRHASAFFAVLTILSALFVLYISGRYAGFRITLNLTNVYGIRAEAADYNIPGIFSYILSGMPILLSFLLLYWLQRRKYLVVGGLCIVFLLLFSISAQKSTFFLLLLILAGYFFYRKWMLRWAPALLILMVIGSVLIKELFGSLWIMSMFIRRVMYLPVQISEAYMEFFQNQPLNLFRYGIMGKLSFDGIYSSGVPYIIGEYMGSAGTSCNNGLLGDVFANLPTIMGLFILPLILVLCFRLMNAVTYQHEPKVTIALCIYFANSFINCSWSVALLSHGFLIACLMLYFFPKKEIQTS